MMSPTEAGFAAGNSLSGSLSDGVKESLSDSVSHCSSDRAGADISCASWAPLSVQAPHMSTRQQQWLTDAHSLTERLERCARVVRVEILSERRLAHDGSWCREVILWGDDKPWVYACSVIPAATLSLTGLDRLGEQPMGRVLFSDPDYQRGAFEFTCLSPELLPSALHRRLVQPVTPQGLWGRRCRFDYQQQPLWLSEIFLPSAPIYQPQQGDVRAATAQPPASGADSLSGRSQSEPKG